MPPTPGGRPIVIVGCPRSGTTLLSVMMHAHPNIAMPPENRFVREGYYRRAEFGDLTIAANRLAVAEWITGTRATLFHDLHLDRAEIMERIVEGAPTIGSINATVLQAYAARHGKARWGEKRPAFWQDLPALLRMFPDAQIVHLIRDGRACVSSMKRLSWWRLGVDGAMTTWSLAHRRIRHATAHLGPDAYHELRYEDLVTDPETSLRALCHFLGEEFDPAMLQHERSVPTVVPAHKTWHSLTRQAVQPERSEAWRSELAPAEIGLFERVARRELHRHGYEPSGLGVAPGWHDLSDYARTYTRRDLWITKRHLNDAAQRLRDRAPLAAC